MSTIITVTPNPCIDKSTIITGLHPDKKLRCSKPVFEPGGGGLNVSRAIHKLGGSSTAIYPAGGYTGVFLNELVQKENIESIVINIKDHTRENLMVVDETTNNQYRFCMPGPSMSEKECQLCLDMIESLPGIGYIVASGSLSPGQPSDLYARIANMAKKKNAKLILDTSGEPLKNALTEGVYLWKPNLGELSYYGGGGKLNSETTLETARQVINRGMAEVIVVSLGGEGALLVTKNFNQQFPTPAVKRKSTIGAGDSMVAGIVLSISKGKTLPEAVRYGIACGTAATMNPGTELCKPEDVEYLYKTKG